MAIERSKWSNIIAEELGVKDQNKLSWMSRYAQIHEAVEAQRGLSINEGIDAGTAGNNGIFATPLNTLGMGNPHMPLGVANTGDGMGIGNTGADFHNPAYRTGSDIPVSTLNMALEVAAITIALELVPVIPSTGPYAFLTYMDTPYAGGKLGTDWETSFDGKGADAANKPIYIKIAGTKEGMPQAAVFAGFASVDKFTDVTLTLGENTIKGKFIGNSRINNELIIKIGSVTVGGKDGSIAEFFAGVSAENTLKVVAGSVSVDNIVGAYPDLVSNVADHVQGFANFFADSEDPMTRAQNETGTGNTLGIRHFTKLVQMGSYEVTGSVTRQQLQDLPAYGIDVIGKILEQMQNQISQEINNRILDRLFRLGVTNAINLAYTQPNSNLNLYLTNDANGILNGKAFTSFGAYKKYVGINGEKAPADWTIKAANMLSNGESFMSNQRRIASRILAAANLITNVSRHGRPSWIVTNTQVLTALQDNANFVVAPMTNTLSQDGAQSIYFAGSIAGLNVYVDPYMKWDDTRVLVGRKSKGDDPGVVFMPYILADTVQTVVEGTMAPKLLCNSRFAIVDAGFYPEQNYYCFAVEADGGLV